MAWVIWEAYFDTTALAGSVVTVVTVVVGCAVVVAAAVEEVDTDMVGAGLVVVYPGSYQ